MFTVNRENTMNISLYTSINDITLVSLYDLYHISHKYRSSYVNNYIIPVYREETLIINEIVHVSIYIYIALVVFVMYIFMNI